MLFSRWIRFLGLLTAIFILGLLIKCLWVDEKNNEQKFLKTVETLNISKSKIFQKINLIGTIKAKECSLLRSKRKGFIRILVPSGTMNVKKNAIIATIDDENTRKTYRLSVSAEKIAKTQYERMRKLALQGIRSQEDFEIEKQKLIAAKKALNQARINNEDALIRAPFEGKLGIYRVKDGEYVSKEYPIISFYNPYKLIIEFDIPSRYATLISSGQKVFIQKKEFQLTQIQTMVDEETHMCPAYVEINNLDLQNYIIGTSIDIELILAEKTNAIVVPRSAVFIKNRKNFVYVVDKTVIKMREVKLGIADEDRIEVIDGLNVGENIVTIGQGRLCDGMSVRIAESSDEF